jgi:hypothetical protein
MLTAFGRWRLMARAASSGLSECRSWRACAQLPLEIKLHALDSGMSVRDYADKVGMAQTTLAERRIRRKASGSRSQTMFGYPNSRGARGFAGCSAYSCR